MRTSTLVGVALILGLLVAPGAACGGGGSSGGGGGGPGPGVPTPDDFEGNDTCAESRRIVLPFSYSTLSIHNPATDDYYRVTLEAADTLTATITFVDATGDLDLELWDGGCISLIASSATGSDTEQVILGLSAGDYLIRVYTVGGSPNNYQMDVSTAAGAGGLLPDLNEPNEDSGSCTQAVLNYADDALSIHSPIDEDYFCFQLGAPAKVTIELRFVHALGDIDVILWERSPPRVVASSTSANNDEKIYDPATGLGLDLPSGNYFVQVAGVFSGTNVYEISITQN